VPVLINDPPKLETPTCKQTTRRGARSYAHNIINKVGKQSVWFSTRLGEPQRSSALAGEALVGGCITVKKNFLKSERIEPKLFLLFAYIY